MLEKLYQYFSIIPLNGKKPIWKDWVNRCSTKKAPLESLTNHSGNFGIVCGFEGLEVIDIDNPFGNADALLAWVKDNFYTSKLLVTKTQGGGYHIYYKCDNPNGSLKLAKRRYVPDEINHIIEKENKYVYAPTKKEGKKYKLIFDVLKKEWFCNLTMVETRGQGGQVVFYDNIISGSIDSVQKITDKERDNIHEICRALNEVAETTVSKTKERVTIDGQLPGDAYNADPLSIQETFNLLENSGWKTNDSGTHWYRPGKEFKDGPSATFGKVGTNRFYNFSSNADPFEPMVSNSMMGVRAILLHGGDFGKCAKELAAIYNLEISEPAPQEQKPKKNKWQILEDIIKDWKIKFRYNSLTTVIDFSRNNGKSYDDKGIDLLYGDFVREMEVNRKVKSISKGKIQDMVATSHFCEVHDPIKYFFSKLPKWNGNDNFLELRKYLILAEDEDPNYFFSMLKKHMIRTIKCAKVRDYVNRMVYTLHGPQEIGKTYFFRWLHMYSELYNEEPVNPGDKDSILALGRYMAINMDELDGLNKKEVSKLKAFISHGTITKRVSYGRHDQNFPRIASFVASTNKSDLLADDLNTRWVILKILSFDWKGYVKNIEPGQLWAQAMQELINEKDSGELTINEKRERDRRNEKEFLEISVEREILDKYFESGEFAITATDLKIMIENKKHPIKIHIAQLSRELKRKFGEIKPTRVNGTVGRYYMLKSTFFTQESAFNIPEYIEEPPF